MPGAQVRRARRLGQHRLERLLGLLGLVLVAAEQVLLDPVGQPGDADAEQPDAAGGVEVGEQPAGEPRAITAGVVGGRRPAWSTG